MSDTKTNMIRTLPQPTCPHCVREVDEVEGDAFDCYPPGSWMHFTCPHCFGLFKVARTYVYTSKTRGNDGDEDVN